MNERISRYVAKWLAHPSGIAQALFVTVLWFASPFLLHWTYTTAIFWYLAYCTFISFATQFTLAYQNHKAEIVLKQTLDNQSDMMRLAVAMAHSDQGRTEALAAHAEAIYTAVDRIDDAVIELLKLAHSESEIQHLLGKQDDSILTVLSTIKTMLESNAQMSAQLSGKIEQQITDTKGDS